MSYDKNAQARTPIGKQAVDSAGSPIGAVRVDVERSYAGIGDLLRDFINDSDQGAWQKIRQKIDYTYECLDAALSMLEHETKFGRQVKERVGRGQKLFFRPNVVDGIKGINHDHTGLLGTGTKEPEVDHTQNQGRYVGRIRNQPDPEALDRYVRSVSEGRARPLDFTLYVPPGFDNLSGSRVPNVEIPTNPSRVFTASFAGGREIWSTDRPLA